MKSLDAIIISDYGSDTFSGTSPLRLHIDNKYLALIQNVKNFVENNGHIVEPVIGENANWQSAAKLNGIALYSSLSRKGHNVELIDSFCNEKKHFNELLKYAPKAIIISTTFILNKKTLTSLVNEIRSKSNAKIIVGGPFVYSSYLLLKKQDDKSYDTESPKEDFLFLPSNNTPDVDLFIISRGGLTILSTVLDRIKLDESINDLPNTARCDDNKYVFSKRIEEIFNTEDIAIEWERIPRRFFSSNVVNIQASVGCPFKCEFCNFVKEPQFTFIKPLDSLIHELKEIRSIGVEYVRFVDDNFRLGKPDLNEVCERFISEGINIYWMSFLRASTLEKTDLNLLKKAGCVEVQIGIESADINVLNNMNKKANPDMYKKVINELLKHGINCSCCFVVGFPGETVDSYKRTIEFIESIPQNDHNGLFYWSIYPFLFVPLSPIYEPDKRAKYKLNGYMDTWDHITMNSNEAKKLVKKAFLEIINSSPIYSGDNINMLTKLTLEKRKAFFLKRHELARLSLTERLKKEQALKVFAEILY
jgi:anaerobic magnesium-protoporphyrin IX monomethyl ester cyclase